MHITSFFLSFEPNQTLTRTLHNIIRSLFPRLSNQHSQSIFKLFGYSIFKSVNNRQNSDWILIYTFVLLNLTKMGDNRSCSCFFQSHHYIALEHRSRISTTPIDTRNGEQQFFLARRIPSCLWREASKSPIRRAYGSRLISRVPQEADPLLDIHALELRSIREIQIPRGRNNHLVEEDRRRQGREERERGEHLYAISRV